MSNRVAEIELDIQGEKIMFPFHFGMATIRQFAVRKGWVSLPFTKILNNLIGEDASFIDQTDFFVFAMKTGLTYTQSKTPPAPESDVQENFAGIMKAAADTIAAYLTESAGKVEKTDEPGKG